MINQADKMIVTTVEGLTAKGWPFILLDSVPVTIKERLLPGDAIRIDTETLEVTELIEPSTGRVKPDCFFYGPCGGCDLLELSEKFRIKEKKAMLQRSIGSIDSDCYVHPFCNSREIVRYMPRMRIHQSRNHHQRDAGYIASKAYSSKVPGGIVPVTACALVTAPLASRIKSTRRVLSRIPVMIESLTLLASPEPGSDEVTGHIVMMKGKSAGHYKKDFEQLLKTAGLKGLSISSHNNVMKEVIGTVSIDGLVAPGVQGGPYISEPSFFVQGNIYQNPVLVRKVVQMCNPKRGKRIIEAFSGAGNFTLALAAKEALVEAIESQPQSARAALKNIHKSGMKDKITFHNKDAAKKLFELEPEPDTLLLDPPRTGTKGIEAILNHLRPESLVYVYCDLQTMQKEISLISNCGYKLKEVAGLDLYPRTAHVEAVCRFERTRNC